MTLLVIFYGSLAAPVESEFSFTRKLETINIIPGQIHGTGWENTHSLQEQDVSGDGLYQSFGKDNSAYPEFFEATVPSSENNSSNSGTSEETSDAIENVDAPAVDSEDSEVIEETPASEVSVPEPASEPIPASEEVSESKNEGGVFGLFSRLTSFSLFAQESVVEPLNSNTDTEEVSEGIDETVVPEATSGEEQLESTGNTEIDTSSKTLVFDDFGVPPFASGQFVTNVQMRLSLGAHIERKEGEAFPRLRVEYSRGAEVWEEAGSIVLDGEVSNALNRGYFLFALPLLQNAEDFKSLKIRVSFEGDLHEEDRVFLDALWLEMDTETFDRELLKERLLPEAFNMLDLPHLHELLSDTLDFTRNDEPVFVLRYESQRNIAIRLLRQLFGRDLAEVKSVTVIRKGVGVVPIEPTVDTTSDGLWTIQIPEAVEDELEPGTYTIELAVDEGGKIFTDSFDFQWGLLAFNPNKTEYQVGEKAEISLAALSPGGNTLCDANLLLYVIDPNQFISRTPVTASPLCNGNNVIDEPDYIASFTPTVPGEYEVYLEHLGPEGEVLAHTKDTFHVIEDQSVSLERSGPTRIYPRAPYAMALTVTADSAYSGELTERVPHDFSVFNTDAEVDDRGDVYELRWHLELNAGESKTVSYEYDAPDISPFLYQLGPASLTNVPTRVVKIIDEQLPTETGEGNIAPETPSSEVETTSEEITPSQENIEPVLEVPTEEVVSPDTETVDVPTMDSSTPDFETVPSEEPTVAETVIETPSVFTEHRAWQIASDATGSMILFWTSGASIPAGWTCISCVSTSTFYQRMPLGGATYGTQGGLATTTHTASGTVNASELSNSENNAGTLVSINSHTHTIAPVIASTTTLPAYRDLRVIQNNSAGDPGTIPAGAILIFDSTLPAGWSAYTALDDRYPRGENTIVSAGSNTHIHTVTGTTTAASGSTYDSRVGGTQVTAAGVTHTHTLSTSTAPVNQEPPYLQVIFATSSVATATPLSSISMWSDTPPAGFLNQSSQVSDPFYNRYIKGGATYGTTGGSETHTHSNFSASSSAAIGTTNARTGASGSSNLHTHMIDLSNFSTASNSPPYVTVIYAKYYGLVPIYTQSAFRWYANANSLSVTDPWPTSTDDVGENEAIDASFGPLRNGDIIRLRLQLNVQNSTTTGEDFKLQFGTTTATCTAISTWTDVGSATSSAEWIGYNNTTPTNGATIPSSVLTGTDILESYVEQNPTPPLPTAIGINKEGEWDFVLKQNSALANTNYCFRMVKRDGTTLSTYSQYPMLITNRAPNSPTLEAPFDNEKVSTTTPNFDFSATDPESDDVTYQIQIDDDYTFASVNADRNTASNPSLFNNVNTPADKDPYTNGDLIRFTLPSSLALTDGATYYWRVRAIDPSGSNSYGSWSTIYSITASTSVTTSTWFQTMEEQFDTDTLVGVDALTTDRIQLISGSTTGTTTSSQLDFLDGTVGNAWGSLSWTDDESVGDIKYRVQYYNTITGAWQFIPDSVLSGNNVGFDTSPVSLLGLDTDTYQLIRLVAVFTNSGGTPTLYDWTVSFGYRIETVTQESPFPSEKISTTTPTFEFLTTDPQGDDLVYQVQWSTTYDFAASTTRSSDINSGFINGQNETDLSPFTSNQRILFALQPADALTNGTTYWWRVRARDPLGDDQYSLFTNPISFTVDTSVTVSTWFQTTESQFTTDVLSGAISQTTGSVTVATTSDESLIVYAEGTVTTPRYREWDGTTWGSEGSALDVGAAINWVVTKASPLENEYLTGTLGTDNDVNVQVFQNGSWGHLQEMTAAIPNASMRGFDIAYEQTSGDALVVYCDGDADPSYYVWNGTTWASGGSVGITNGNACGWIKLISDPVSDEIIAVTRDTSGITYEARVWNGSSWGNGVQWGSMQSTQTGHEGIAAEYEDSGDQAVVAVSNGTNGSFSWRAWSGAAWTAAAAVALGDDFESGTVVQDVGSDNLALCYVDEDADIGVVRWTGAVWTGQTELDTVWTPADNVYNDRPIDCAFEVSGSRDGYIMAAYSTTTNLAYRFWNGAVWSTAAPLSTIQDSPRVQLSRTGANILQLLAFDNTNDRYDYTYWDGASWSSFQTLETDASVGATPYKEPFMNAARNPTISGTAIVSPGIDFYDGAGPYWQQLSWSDSEPSGSSILYQVEYYDGDSWELVPDGLIPGNSTGNSTSPVSLTNVLPVSTYNMLRPVANLTCNLGTCPTLSDWTVTWAAGITVSGTAQAADQSTNLTSGTVQVALNGVLQVGKTSAITAGAWSISNVNATPGDIITVYINGVNDANEAVGVTRYDGTGNITGMVLYERHLTMGSDDATSTPFTNADLGLYDTTNDEDLFFDVTGTTLTMCGNVNCGDNELYIKNGAIYQPTGTANVNDIEINGTFKPEGNTFYVSGSWDNNATVTSATSTIVFTATSTNEYIDETGALTPSFYNLTFSTTTSSAVWTASTSLDVNGNLVLDKGTFARGTTSLTIAGNLTINTNGVLNGLGTTTFDGSSTTVITDNTASLQNLGRVVVDGTLKTAQLGTPMRAQSLTIGGDDTFDVSTGNYALTILSHFINNNTFLARNGTTTFTGTTTNLVITAGGDPFYNLAFNGAGGAWSFTEAALNIDNDLTIATGTVTMPTGTTTITGSFTNTGAFSHNNATVVMNASTAESITQSGTAFGNAFYNLRFAGSGSWSWGETNATTSNDLRIAQGTVTFPSGTLSVGQNFQNTAGTFVHNSGTLKFTGSGSRVIDPNASFYNLLFTGNATTSFVDANVTAVEDVTTQNGTTTFPSGTFTIGGSLTNTASIAHNNGTVLLNTVDTGETISLGNSSLYNLTVNSGTGGWTMTASGSTTNAFTLTNASTFTLSSGQTLSVGGVFTTSIGGASTTWTGSTLSLESGAYSINTKTTTGDQYGTLRVKANTDIQMWNSSSTAYTVDSTGSLYSADHSNQDGDLYIFGSYERGSGTEYWSYATDFDGTALGGSSRQVDVKFAAGASALFSTSTLNITGTTTGTTTIRNQGSGTYTLSVAGGTTTASYYDFADLGSTGLTLTSGTKVTSLGDGRFVPGIAAGTGITVSSSTIDANPGLQIHRVEFSTTTAISATNVTQTGGTPSSYWWFRESTGNIDGEAFDSDTGDPGSIRWDDSSLTITVGGTVYAADGTTPLGAPTCGAGTPVRIAVEGGGVYDGACNGSGVYSIPGVVVIGDPTLTVFLNGASGGERAVTVTKTPTTNITNLNLIVGRVIVRHEDVSAMTIDDMSMYDATDDSDIPFTAATGTTNSLIVQPNIGLNVWATTTFTPGGTVTLQSGGSGTSYDGSLTIGNAATFTGAGTTTYSIGGSFTQGTGGTFIPASSTVVMTATTSGKGIVSATGETISLNALSFTGVGGGWNLNGNISLTGDLSLATGTFTGTGNVTLPNGSFSGNGLLSLGSGTTTLASTNILGGSQAWTFANLVLGTGSTNGTTSKATTATTTISGKLTIGTGHFFQAFGSVIDLQGSGTVFVENGTLIEATSTVRYSGTGGSNVLSTTYYNLKVDALGSSPTFTGTGLGIVVTNALTVGGFSTTTFTMDTNDPAFDINGNILIASNGTFIGSGSAVFTAAGNWDNDGTYTGSGGTVTFDGSGIHTIAAGNSSFSSVTINGTGDFTISENATSTATFTITAANDFHVQSGVSLAVGGTFQNTLGGADTIWTGSTLFLYGGGNYQINASTINDAYSKLTIGASTQIRMWNSSASTTDLAPTASLYSQDHAAVDGDLYIYGAYTKTSGTDYWNYATDFDGTVLGGGSRRSANVRIQNGSSLLYTAGGLSIVGTTTGSTTIQNQGSGTYTFRIGGSASTTMSYYSFSDMDASGVVFSGSPTVVNLSNGNYTVGVASGTAMTVGGTVITQNPAKTFTTNNFSTSTGGLAFNVTATGTTASLWRFTNHAGSIDGEAYNIDPGGDPGYILWDDSASAITISGHIYSDEGVSTSTVCDGVTNNIAIRVKGLTSYTTSCNATSSAYSMTGVLYSPGDSLVLYLDGASAQGATVTEDPTGNISNLDLYVNRVIVRHESSDSLSIADMAYFDSTDDPDIPFTAVDSSPDTLTLPANKKLLVWSGKEFQPNGNVTISGGGAGAAYDGTLELQTNATFNATGAESHTIGGSLIMGNGATLDTETSTFTFTTTGAARTIDTNDQSFYNLTLNGSGSWTITNTVLGVGNDLTITQGSVTLPSGTSTIAGSFLNTGGSFSQNGGSMYFTASAAKSIRTNGSSFGTTTFAGTGSYTYLDTNGTSTGPFTILSGTVTAASGTLTVGGSFINNATFTHNSGTLRLTSTQSSTTIYAGASDLSNVVIQGTGTFIFTDATEALIGSLTFLSGTTSLPTTTISIGGSLTSSGGAFIHSTGTVLFNSSDTGETINPGNSTFTHLTIAAPTGGYTITGNATTTGNFSLTSATSFTLQAGKTLGIQGIFTNLVGGTSTVWTSSTINLLSNANYTVNTKTTGGDVYNNIVLGNNTDLRLWNSSATTTLSDALSSLYSQDNAAVDGELYIYGNYSRTTGTDYWSAATDFDGTSIATATRAVAVRHAAGATSTFSGGALSIIGTASATTTITNQGAGTYAWYVSGGTLTAQNYAVRNINATGLSLSGTTTVTSLQNGDFELAVSGGSLISLSSTTLNYNASLVISGMRFATTTAITGTNVNLSGTTSAAWTFTTHRGNLAGEAYDNDGATSCGSIRWSDSVCLLSEQTGYRWRTDNGGEGVPDSEWYNTSWSKRKRLTITNADAQAYTNAVVEVNITYDSDMQNDFDDLRFTDSTGTSSLSYVLETFSTSTQAKAWVKIPTLPASQNTTIYMYYGNGSATSSGVGSSTFAVYDDFEDNNITEYSGDNAKFALSNTFAYQGARGLGAANPADRTTDGIYNTNVTVARGQTIRFQQYINTSAGSGDETCTLFGVQAPGANNNNYAVCLEQFGVDRVSISKNVYDNDTNGTVLASTTISYTTGWYEVEIDWKTNNAISVGVYQNDVLVASTSVTDNTYSSGGIGFTYWFQNGGWDLYSARTYTVTDPTVTTGGEQVRSGASWLAALNTATTGVSPYQVIRPRFVIQNTGLVAFQQYRLEYASKGVAPSCEAVLSASYAPVPVQASCTGSPICMQASSNFTNYASTTDVLGSSGTFSSGQIVEDPSNTTQSITLNSNEYTEVEYAIVTTNDATDSAYCLRVTNNGTELDSYTHIAELGLVFAPSISSITFNNGADITLNPGSTTTVYATGTVSDLNGYTDIAYATTTMFRSGVGSSCSADTNSCYVAGPSQCTYTNCAGNSCDIVCRADFYYYADPTDTGSTYDAQTWGAMLAVKDLGGLTATQTAPYVDLLTLHAINASDTINYGALAVNTDTGSYNASTTFMNIGNDAIDILVEGTNLSDGSSSTIPVSEQKFATSTFTYSSCVYCTQLSTTSMSYEVDLTKPTTTASGVTDVLYWGIEIPYGVSAHSHSGSNTFYAVDD